MSLLGGARLGRVGDHFIEFVLARRRVIERTGNFPGAKIRRPRILAYLFSKEKHLMSVCMPAQLCLLGERPKGGGEKKNG